MPRLPIILFLFCLIAPLRAQDVPVTDETRAFAGFTRAWRNDPAWNHGSVEIAAYDATRAIDGKPVSYQARVTTNKELADPVTKVKSTNDQGREVFKQLTLEAIPGDSARHILTMVCVGASDLKSLRIDASTQDPAGVTFKWFANHKGTLEWQQFSYHPGEGHKSGSYAPPEAFVFQDTLAVVLRGYPFEQPRDIQVQFLPVQTTGRLTPAAPRRGYIHFAGRETLHLPFGKTDAFRVQAYFDANEDGSVNLGQPPMMDYWFAADPRLLHVLVQYQGPDGTACKLRSLERKRLE